MDAQTVVAALCEGAAANWAVLQMAQLHPAAQLALLGLSAAAGRLTFGRWL